MLLQNQNREYQAWHSSRDKGSGRHTQGGTLRFSVPRLLFAPRHPMAELVGC